LIHISKLGAGRRLNHPREVLEEGQNIEVKIDKIDLAEKRISLLPADYVSEQSKEAEEREEYSSYIKSGHKAPAGEEVGSLGALLKAKLGERKK
jgi:small subunit ribosomal protein S1